uniref:protein-tyrosine-phosphatase n=1 Tax=Eptatretus burgeri TaxID=7764 RepID=A0A8C4QIH2_EPTBU
MHRLTHIGMVMRRVCLHGSGTVNENSTKFLDFVRSRGLRVPFSWFQLPEAYHWTWDANTGGVAKEIDHVLVDGRWRMIQNCRVYRSAQFLNTDHRLVVTLTLQLKSGRMVPSQLRLYVGKLEDERVAEEFVNRLRRDLGGLGALGNSKELRSDFKNTILDVIVFTVHLSPLQKVVLFHSNQILFHRRILFKASSLISHLPGSGNFASNKRHVPLAVDTTPSLVAEPPLCSSWFVEPLAWMETSLLGVTQGQLSCPKCRVKLGSFSWCGLQCSCSAWVTPAFCLHRARLDPPKDRGTIPQSVCS